MPTGNRPLRKPPGGSPRKKRKFLPDRLLRQPGGFEGFTAVGVSTEASDQPTVEVGDPRRRCVDGGTAVLSPAADVSQGESGVSDVANFLDLPVEGLPGFIDGRAVLGASVVAPVDGPFQGRLTGTISASRARSASNAAPSRRLKASVASRSNSTFWTDIATQYPAALVTASDPLACPTPKEAARVLRSGPSRPLVVVAPTAHGAAHRTQYPKDHAKDDQDDTDCPKDGVTPKKGGDDQADDADGDQVSLPCSGSSSASTLSDLVCPWPALLRQPGRFEGPGFVLVLLVTGDTPVAQREEDADLMLDPCVAALHLAAFAHQRHDPLVSGIDQLD